MQFIPAYHTIVGDNLPPTRIVIHTTVSPCVVGGAVATAQYFQSPNSGGSAHKVVDPATVVQCLPDNAIAWHAPPNPNSLGIEFCDPMVISGTETELPASRWQDADHVAMLKLGAAEVRDWCDKYNIPIVRISAADLLAGKHGICGHVDVSQAFGQSSHWDPGTGFPWDTFIQMVQDAGPNPLVNGSVADMVVMSNPVRGIWLAGPGYAYHITPVRWPYIWNAFVATKIYPFINIPDLGTFDNIMASHVEGSKVYAP